MNREFKLVVGLIVMGASASIEREFHKNLPEDIGIVTTRVPFHNISEHGLIDMVAALPAAAKLLAEARPDLIIVTSSTGSYLKGNEIVNIIQQATGIPVLTPAMVFIDMLERLGAKKIGFISILGQELFLIEQMFYYRHDIVVARSMNIGTLIDVNPYILPGVDVDTLTAAIQEQDFGDVAAIIFDHPTFYTTPQVAERLNCCLDVPLLSMVDLLIKAILDKTGEDSSNLYISGFLKN